MNKTYSAAAAIIVFVTVFFAAGCPKRVTIAEIEANPTKYHNKEVAVAGTVRDSWGVSVPGTGIRGGAYKIDDGTGSFWVITREAVPTKGAKIGVKGKIGSGIVWNGRNYGLGMYETDRRIAKR